MNRLAAFLLMMAAGVSGRPEGYSYPTPAGILAEGSEVEKHIYVHVPPPDPEFHAPPPRVVAPPPPKKHYKIVFIKAPTYSPPPAPVIPEIQQHQEKTLIYVLHKNPTDAAPIVIPTAKPTQPSKPEVYFIRYKTQKELSASPSPHTSYLPASPSSSPNDNVFITSTRGAISTAPHPHQSASSPLPQHPLLHPITRLHRLPPTSHIQTDASQSQP